MHLVGGGHGVGNHMEDAAGATHQGRHRSPGHAHGGTPVHRGGDGVSPHGRPYGRERTSSSPELESLE